MGWKHSGCKAMAQTEEGEENSALNSHRQGAAGILWECRTQRQTYQVNEGPCDNSWPRWAWP